MMCSTQQSEYIAGHIRESVSLGQPPLFPAWASKGFAVCLPGYARRRFAVGGLPGEICRGSFEIGQDVRRGRFSGRCAG